METKTLPAFKVVYEDGTSYVTSMRTDMTEAEARAYFMGRTFEQDDERTHKQVVDIQSFNLFLAHQISDEAWSS